VLVLHESADLPLAQLSMAEATSIVLVVGPEGGISEEEVDALTDAGSAVVRLGPTVLRTSTAAAVALGALGVLTSRWSVDAPKRYADPNPLTGPDSLTGTSPEFPDWED
jgi:16S rRNA (uracil1498-N3)-methyltransferase